MENRQIRYLHSSDRALSVEFGNEISETIHNQIRAFCHLLKERRIPGITEIVPTYCSVMVHYEPDVIFYDALSRPWKSWCSRPGISGCRREKLWKSPSIMAAPVARILQQ